MVAPVVMPRSLQEKKKSLSIKLHTFNATMPCNIFIHVYVLFSGIKHGIKNKIKLSAT